MAKIFHSKPRIMPRLNGLRLRHQYHPPWESDGSNNLAMKVFKILRLTMNGSLLHVISGLIVVVYQVTEVGFPKATLECTKGRLVISF